MDTSETAKSCEIYLDNEILTKLTKEVRLVNFIELSPAHLMQYRRLPDGVRSV